jgi:hypothetical protein
MVERRLSDGRSGYYWIPAKCDVEAGCGLRATSLGSDYSVARDKAEEINRKLDAWRGGETIEMERRLVREGTIDWWFHVWRTETVRWLANLRDRSREPYERAMRVISELPLPEPSDELRRTGDLNITALTPRAVDELYLRLYNGRVGNLRTRRGRSAEAEMDLCRVAWDDVKRLYPEFFPTGPNPFVGLTRVRRAKQKKRPATREEAYSLAGCLRAEGHPHLVE